MGFPLRRLKFSARVARATRRLTNQLVGMNNIHLKASSSQSKAGVMNWIASSLSA
jgi:hypothetical protein